MAPARLKCRRRRSVRWAGMVRKPCGRQQDTRPGETPRTGTGTRTAACATCATPALYCTRRTREMAGKAAYAREGRGENVRRDGEHGQERPRLLAPSLPLCQSSQQARAPPRFRYSRVRRVLELSSPRSLLHLGDTAEPALCQFLTTHAEFLPLVLRRPI
ncbi:hypothetical protein FB451DRAFT_1258221 [Mycena latifolia]|nr:hypothetical protein FB451DRAFT_1258221 [Mycena latifolia]